MENKVLFRCSNLAPLMSEPKLKADKEAGKLSQGAMTLVEDLWLKNNYGYDEEIITDQILKGILCEQDSIALVQQVLGGEFRISAKRHPEWRDKLPLKNDYICGNPDIILTDCVEDIKTSFDIRTFFRAELTDQYELQLQGYMALTGKKKARLIYCLVDTPLEIVTELKKRAYFKFNCDEQNPDYIRISEQHEFNHEVASRIEPKDRVKIYEFDYNPETIIKLYGQIEKARNYYETLSLNKI